VTTSVALAGPGVAWAVVDFPRFAAILWPWLSAVLRYKFSMLRCFRIVHQVSIVTPNGQPLPLSC
jgi:hypothetical protein